MSIAVAKRLISVADYYKMAQVGIIRPEDRLELIDGDIYEMSPLGSKHAGIVTRFAEILFQAFFSEYTISIQNPVRIDSHNEPEPDISILRKRVDSYTESHPRPSDILAVIEVAESSIAFDQGVKKDLYARAGIDTYLIVNLIEQRVELYTAPQNGDFSKSETLKKGDSFALLGQLLKTSDILIA